ncbi:inositol 1,4,5-triphosphate receptor associated 1 isoform X3 [Amblyraja radiata]|uniref:inositol 1,4,5-triphosphate receptor associated 1 isoform X3 n=1 Tax=Amblyraja radiata TaxID=386614 RepID=UPI001402B7D8|nr:inositol 1,4,5-triphosphate receptor associated 1 isoform X3 [Amblyraja radiata]
MTSKGQAEKVRSLAVIEGLPSLQRGQALDHEEKDSLCSNFVSRLDSGLGAGTTCSSMDGYDNVNMAVGVSLTRSLNAPRETSAGEVFGRQVEFVNDKSSDDAMPSEEGAASYDDEPGLCSEEDVLNFTFKACDTEGTGRVAASVIVRYLQEMTGQSQDGRLQVLHNMLDPERKDIAIDRGGFHLTMRSWIANCTQDGCFQSDCTCAKGTGSSATREASELINNIADLKYANRKLRDQNSSLQKALEVSDETNLQLSKELTKLKNHLMSSQRTIHSLQSVVEELEDARSAGREARERVHQLGTECKELKKENEALVAQLWSASGKIEKMERDKRQLKYRIDELLTQNADMTKQIHEAQNLLISKDALIFEENILIEELKMSKAKSCKVIEGLRAELKKSQGKICQDLFSCKLGVWKSSPGLPPNRAVWFPASLQQEIRESQKEEGFETLPDPVCGLMPQQDHGDHFQEILSHIKAKRHGFLFRRTVNEMVDQLNVHAAAFMTLLRTDYGQQLNVQELRKELEQTIQAVVQKLHLLAPIKDSWDESMEVLEGACMQCQQQYLNIKHKLADTIRELELENVLRKEAEEQAVVAEERAEEAMLEAEAIRTQSLGASKLDEAWEDVAALGRDVEVPTLEVDGRSLTSNRNEEKLCPLELQVWQPVNEAKAEALEKMAAALDAAEARVKAWKARASEAEMRVVEMEQAVAAAGVKADTEGDKALLYLAEAEKLKGEIESLMMQAEESTKRTSAMEEQMAELSQMLSAAELEASSAQHRAVLAEEGQLVALATIPRGDSQRKIAAEQAMGTHPSGSSPSHSTKMFVGDLQSCPGSEKNVANEGAAQPPCEAADEANDSSANRKQEPDVQHLSQETLGQLHHHGPCPLAGRCKGHGSSGHCPSLLDALNLEHSWSCQPFGIQKHFRPSSLGRHREGAEKPSPSEEHRTEAGEAQTAARNILGGTKSLKADEEQALSPEAEAQLPATTLPEEEDSAPISSLRLLLSNFTLPGLDPPCRSAGSSTRGPRCTVAPSMPTLPEEEEGTEHRDTTQNSKPNLPGAGTRMNTTPAIVLPEVFNTSDRESDQAAHIRCHSPVQRRSSRNSRASSSSASSLTSVDGDGHVYNLVNDELPDMELSDEDRKKNTDLLEEAKKLSERFLSRRSRRSRSSASDSPPELDVPVVRTMVVPSPQAGEEPPPSPVRDKDMKENKLMRNQTLAGQRLPDLSEINEQDRGPSPVPSPAVDGSCNITPSIPDSLLRKLKVQRSLSAGLPPLTEKEIENTFIQLSLAFKNDSYTLETRLGLAERERNLAEDNTERELENFKSELKFSSSLWVQSELRNAQERLLETVGVLQRLAVRLSGRAEMVGAVRQEKRMSKATEVMIQYVENLKRMYEKDHAELTEYKKLANQNSSRSYSPYGDGSDDGVPRTARSMSLTLGKTVPRRRVSVAVLPKFINFPGHPPSSSMMPTVALMESQSSTETNSSNSTSNAGSSITTSPITTSPSTIPSSSSRIGLHSSPMLSPLVETKQNGDKEVERPVTGDIQPLAAEVASTVTKAKIEEDAFNKGYQEGLKAQLSQERKESRQEPGKEEGWSEEAPTPSSFTEGRKSSKFEEVSALMVKLCPRPLKHRCVIWIVAMMVLLFAVLVNIFSSQRSPCEDTPSTPGVKGSCPSAHGSPWPFSRLWRKNRAQA